jgi:predicted Zn-dependent protease
MLMAAMGAGLQYGVLLPFSRDHETEADEVGLMLSAAACFKPQEAIGLWQRMGANRQGEAPPEWMSTHPSGTSRIERLRQWMPRAEEFRERYCAPSSDG